MARVLVLSSANQHFPPGFDDAIRQAGHCVDREEVLESFLANQARTEPFLALFEIGNAADIERALMAHEWIETVQPLASSRSLLVLASRNIELGERRRRFGGAEIITLPQPARNFLFKVELQLKLVASEQAKAPEGFAILAGDRAASRGERVLVLRGPRPEKGTWQANGDTPRGSVRWRWIKSTKPASALSGEAGAAAELSWEVESKEEPLYDEKRKAWIVRDEAADLRCFNKGQEFLPAHAPAPAQTELRKPEAEERPKPASRAALRPEAEAEDMPKGRTERVSASSAPAERRVSAADPRPEHEETLQESEPKGSTPPASLSPKTGPAAETAAESRVDGAPVPSSSWNVIQSKGETEAHAYGIGKQGGAHAPSAYGTKTGAAARTEPRAPGERANAPQEEKSRASDPEGSTASKESLFQDRRSGGGRAVTSMLDSGPAPKHTPREETEKTNLQMEPQRELRDRRANPETGPKEKATSAERGREIDSAVPETEALAAPDRRAETRQEREQNSAPERQARDTAQPKETDSRPAKEQVEERATGAPVERPAKQEIPPRPGGLSKEIVDLAKRAPAATLPAPLAAAREETTVQGKSQPPADDSRRIESHWNPAKAAEWKVRTGGSTPEDEERRISDSAQVVPAEAESALATRLTLTMTLAELGDDNSSWHPVDRYRIYLSAKHRYYGARGVEDFFPLWVYDGELAPEFLASGGGWKFYDRLPDVFYSLAALPIPVAAYLRKLSGLAPEEIQTTQAEAMAREILAARTAGEPAPAPPAKLREEERGLWGQVWAILKNLLGG